ncbi:putative casein kinase II subunit beta-4 isoform X2 [Magnolia sinica]|uniref:putative casein kinase II subunit beta-4 isoform X2 n=1 Tax=Magnolia sinica TaxID=86752 RepID=UPI00265B0E36|nr:putative casein kinase II subunit beta-4 isoform X2 [Magnolia sinica]
MSKAAASSRVGGAPRCSPSANPNPNPDLNTAGDWNQNPSRRNPSNATTAKKQSDTASTSKKLSETGSEETELSCSEGDDSSWITWFCGLRGNELLCEVDEDYIRDDFNLCGLQGQVPYYDYALDMILDDDSLSAEVDSDEHSQIESAAELLYGLIHARYIITSKGLNAMHEKYKRVDFGRCPRVFCGGQPCLPVGSSDIPHNGSVEIYCPKCKDLYLPRCKYQSNMDGAYIGTTFPHLYLMTYPSAKPVKPVQNYVPRVFGFKLYKGSR